MPKTRSQTVNGQDLRVYVDYPASPSTVQPSAPQDGPTRETGTIEESSAPPASTAGPPPSREQQLETRSVRSTVSVSARIRRVEIQAEERLAELKRKELQLEADLIKKRLAADIDTLREESEQGSVFDRAEDDVDRRVSEWVDDSQTRDPAANTIGADAPSRTRANGTERGVTATRVAFKERPVTLHKGTPREDPIDRLADALDKITRNGRRSRPPELPLFAGAPGEWLPFKAAVREASAIYDIPPVENLARLRACLKGEARQCVAALLYTASEPSGIMATLEQRYGRPEIIIDQALEELKRLPRIGTTAADLNNFAIKLQNIVTVIACLDAKGYLKNPMLTRHVTEKMSDHYRSRWCDFAEEHSIANEAEIETLSRFFMREAERAVRHCYSAPAAHSSRPNNSREALPTSRSTQQPSRPAPKPSKAHVYATTTDTPKEGTCLCCGSVDHATTKCKKLRSMTTDDRWRWAKETATCFLCLESKHRKFRCKAKRCGLNECQMAHHSLLHVSKKARDDSPAEQEEDSAITASAQIKTNRRVLLKVCPVTLKGPAGTVEAYGLLDEGSTVSLIDDDLAAQLGACGPSRPLNIHGVTNSQREADSRAIEIGIRGRRQKDYESIKARTVRRLELGGQSVAPELLNHPHLRRLDRDDVCYGNVRPRVLIGADNWHLIVSRKLLTGKRTQPAASLTKLGWVVHGTTPHRLVTTQNERVLHITTSQEKDRDELHDLVRAQFEFESLGISNKPKPVAANERALTIFNRTVKKRDGYYEVGLPWRTDDVELPPSYDMALRRLRSVERKMDKSPEYKTAYSGEVNKLIEKGYAMESDADPSYPRTWYLPHFAVTNPNKPGKVRLVFDAAARSNGICMNDVLLDGPDLLNSLSGILYRFRENPIAITADIREMFLRVKIREEDRATQHFLWRGDDRKRPPQTYIMNSMIFGARSSPFLAHSVRNRNAEEHRYTHPLAYVPITRHHYMDDWVQSFGDEDTAAKTMKEVIEVHRQAGFELAGWSSNQPSLLEGVDCATAPKELGGTGADFGKTLGLKWLAATDELAFNTAMPRVPEDVRSGRRTPTKREALGAVMSIFDPSGHLSQYGITAKAMLQNLWRQAVAWDDPLPTEEAACFAEWIRDLEYVEKIRIPRCYTPRPPEDRQLHVFVDASEQAYAAVAYWRFSYADGSVHLALIAGKARVAPMRQQSIPRMELQASLIGARLSADIKKEHVYNGRVVYWSDSKTALHWIRNDSARYTPYVAHRLGEIAELTDSRDWRWVPTAHNVADDATRPGNTRVQNNDRWFTGPPFLHEPEEDWPGEEAAVTPDTEECYNVRATENLDFIKIERFSQWERLIRATGYALLFIKRCRRQKSGLTALLLEEAERLVLRQAQRDSFPDDFVRLERGKEVERESRLRNLGPVLRPDGLVRLNGRIDAAAVINGERNPPILDGRHHLTTLLIRREHERQHHAGRETIVNNLRQRFWITRLRPAVRKVLNRCVVCRARTARPTIPAKGDLPSVRLETYKRPFSNCGLDAFGPYQVTVGRRHEKRWGLLFTCLVTRAIHIELISTLSTDSAIMALRRMAARRGWPRLYYSDNGTNFRGADIELGNAYNEWLPELKDYALTRRVEWRFIDPGAPNQGGAWERLIRSVKSALSVTLNERAPKDEVLATLMTEVEYTVNSRPLTHVPVEIGENEALTPNHFLLGSSTGMPYVGGSDLADRRAWRNAQALADSFWKRWIDEYLPTLAPRGKSNTTRPDLKVGDLVVIADGLLPRNLWPRGRVEKIMPGKDGIIRSAEVHTRGGIFRRPIRRLIVLPINGKASVTSLGGICSGQMSPN